jgi:hypothetical protein
MQPTIFSINGLSVELGRNARAIAKALKDTPSDGVCGLKRLPRWKLTTALAALERHDRRGGVPAVVLKFDEAAASELVRLADYVDAALQELAHEPDIIKRRSRSPEIAQAIEQCSDRLEALTPPDDRPFTSDFRDKLIGQTLRRLLSLCEWEIA